MANFNQLKCPSCGATLNLEFPNQLILECPYCHQQVVNDTYRFSGKDNAPRVLEFEMTENEVVEQIVDLLIKNQDVPSDIFDRIKNTSIEKYYVPMYIFEGTFRAPWTAEKPREEKRQRIGRNGEIENYYETLYDYFNGEATGNFSVNGIPSDEIIRLNLDSKLLQEIVINPSQLSQFSKIQKNSNDSIEILTPSSESDSVWWKSGEPTAYNIGIEAAYSQAPGFVKSCSACCELKNTIFVYIPLWKIRYEYNDEMFYFIYYAEQFFDYNHPKGVRTEAQPTKEQQMMLDGFNQKDEFMGKVEKFVFYPAVIAIIILFFGSCMGIQFLEYLYDKHFVLYIILGLVVFYIVGYIIFYYYKRKFGIDSIHNDIKKRTCALQHEADNYRKESGRIFLKTFSKVQNHSEVYNSTLNEIPNPTPIYEANLPKTKTCVRCSKQIDVHHMYCRYCGAKQN